MNRRQWRVLWGVLVVILLCLAAGWWWESAAVLVIGAIVVWKFSGAVKPPEIATVKSVRCAGCGNIGEPHWKTCPRCGSTEWKTS